MSATESRQAYMQGLGASYLAASENISSDGVYYRAAMTSYPDNIQGETPDPRGVLPPQEKTWVKPLYLLGIAGIAGYFLLMR
jgi:hypothetical protein